MRKLNGNMFVPHRQLAQRLKILKDEVFPDFASFRIDPVFGGMDVIYFFFLFALLALGIVTVYSASYQYSSIVLNDSDYFLVRQLQAAILGLLGFWLALRLDVNLLMKKWVSWSIYGFAVALCALCAVVGIGEKLHIGFVNHIRFVHFRWVRIGPINFQTSELARFAVVLFLARYGAIKRAELERGRGYIIALIYAGFLALPLLLQPHLSGAAIVIILALGMIWASGSNILKIAAPAMGLGALGLVAAKVTGYGWERIRMLRDLLFLTVDSRDQMARSMEAFATGGLSGVGLGAGVHKFGSLPEIHTDFIFAHLAEEQGIVIAIAMLIAFMFLFKWGLTLAEKLSNPYQSLLAFGLSAAFVLPAFLNMLVAIGMFFPTGVPFPLLSYGGSSLVINLFMFGLLLNLSARAFEETLEKPVRWVIAGGGTGGHVVPGIALAQRIVERWPQDHVVFVGVGSAAENRLLSIAGFDSRKIKAAPVVGQKGFRVIGAIFKNLFATFGAIKLLMKVNPDRVIGIGGYVSVPVVLAAWFLRIPCALFEPDAKGGLANRFLAKFSTVVFVAFEKALKRYPQKKTDFVGPLVRLEFFKLDEWIENKPGGFIVFVVGGSQGSHVLASALSRALTHLVDLRNDLIIYCQAREEDKASIENEMAKLGFVGEVRTFFDNVWILYAWADLIISRAGANSVYELCAAKKPAILIPYPHALGHQEKNAEVLVDAGAAEMIRDEEFSGDVIAQKIKFYFQNPAKLRAMSEAYKNINLQDGATKTVEMVRSR